MLHSTYVAASIVFVVLFWYYALKDGRILWYFTSRRFPGDMLKGHKDPPSE